MIPLRSVSIVLFICTSLSAADPEPPFERGIDLIRTELAIARTGLRALSVAAHPDDEDGGTLAWLRRVKGVETHICLATRGEGGQNEAGPELGPELAVVRTRETEAAAAILGAKVTYLNLPEFGFTRSIDETLEKWNHDVALERLVRVIRTVRPHLIFSNHHPDRTDHGHHRALAKILFEAFDAAADATKFPDQKLAPWTTQKLYTRTFAPQEATVIFDVSDVDPETGVSPTEIAAFSISRHTSQGMLRTLKLGERDVRNFTRIRPAAEAGVREESMLADLKAEPLNGSFLIATEQLVGPSNLAVKWNHVPTIVKACKELEPSKEVHASRLRHVQLALIEALGIKVDVAADDPITTYDETVTITLRVVNSGKAAVTLQESRIIAESDLWEVSSDKPARELKLGESVEVQATAKAKVGAYPTYPHAEHIHSRSTAAPPLRVELTFACDGVSFPLTRPIPLDLALPRELRISPNPVLIFHDPSRDAAELARATVARAVSEDNIEVLTKFRIVVTNHRKLAEPLVYGAKTGTAEANVANTNEALKLEKEEESNSAELRRWAKVLDLNNGDIEVPTTLWNDKTNIKGPVAKLRRVAMKLPPSLTVALVKAVDDSVLNALKRLEAAGLGLTFTQLTDDDLAGLDLNRFHTIILDLRATQYRPMVRNVRERLMKFMNEGGNVVCLGHKDFDWNTEKQEARGRGFFRGKGGGGEIAPYPIELSFDRVTREDSPVRILNPDHPLLLVPNKIWERDFDGWVQERGTYFPGKWDSKYAALLSMNDPDEKKALDGGLLVADVGAGSFIYTSLTLYRQLNAGVPGAYRILANLISYPRVRRK